MSKAITVGRSWLRMPDLAQLAIQTKLIQRKSSKFTADAFLQSLLSAVATGHASFNQLVGKLKDRVSAAMARQSYHERLDKHAVAFLIAVLHDLMEQRYQCTNVLRQSPVQRVIIEDASAQVMPKANAEEFPAHGNHHGPTAGVKIDFAYDLLSGSIVSHTLNGGTEQDKTIGREMIATIRKGDLVLRDMGYFCIGEFTAIEKLEAYWLTRLPLTTGVKLPDGMPLEKLLKRSKDDILDMEVIVGEEGKKCRMIAVRASKPVVATRRAERRAKAKKSGKKPCPKGLVRDGWHLMLTNLTKEQATVAQLTAVYRARWAIEIQFRAWKQSLNMDDALNRKSNKFHMEALVLAGMIAHQLGMKIARHLSEMVGRGRLSVEKLYDLLADQLVKAKGLDEVMGFTPEPRHIMRDKRQRKSPVESGIEALT